MGIIEELERKRDVEGLISIVRECRIDSGEAAEALGRLKDKRAVEPLIEAIDSDYGGLMWGAMSALGQIKDKRAVEPLVSALGDRNLASDASRALREILAGEAVEVFIKVLEAEAQDIPRKRARRMLQQDVRGVVARCSAADYLGQSGDKRAVEPLIKALHNKNEWVRNRAAIALGQIKNDRAVEPLIEALKDRDRGVRRQVTLFLACIKDDRAVDPLVERLEDENEFWDVAREAAKALGDIGDKRAIEPLERALEHWHEAVRTEARKALEKIKRRWEIGSEA